MPDTTGSKVENEAAKPIDWFDRGIKIANVFVSLAGFTAVVIGLHLTTQQLEANQRTAESNLWNDVSKQWLELDKFFLLNPDARNFVYGRGDVRKDDKSYNAIMAQSTYVLDFIDYVINPVGDDPTTREFVDIWKNYAKRVFLNSLTVCHELLENEDNYGPATKTLGKQYCHP